MREEETKNMFFIKAILMMLFPFYRIELPVASLPNEFQYQTYERGAITYTKVIKKDDPHYQQLKKIIIENKNGWKYDFVTYAPTHIFKSDALNINCIGKLIIINFKSNSNDGWEQISKETNEDSCTNIIKKARPGFDNRNI